MKIFLLLAKVVFSYKLFGHTGRLGWLSYDRYCIRHIKRTVNPDISNYYYSV